jgi:tetratricopeptide (TPR) repeat protein
MLATHPEASPQHLFESYPRLLHRNVVLALISRAHDQLRVDFTQSAMLADAAAIIARTLGDDVLVGKSLRAKGNAVGVAGNNQAAVDLHTDALAALEAAGDEMEVARTLNASVQPLILLGQYDRALQAAHRAREIFAGHGDERRLARLDINIGNLFHRQDRFEQALEVYERAYNTLVAADDLDGVVSALHNQAVVLISLNRFRDALEAYARARELAAQHARPLLVNQSDYNIAWLHYLRGDYSRAIELLHTTADVCKRNGDAYHTALAMLDLSEIYLELNLSDDAREMAEQAVARFRDLGIGYETAKAIANAAMAQGQQGKSVAASDLFSTARELMVREQNQVWPPLIDVYQALLLFNEGRVFESRRLSLAALEALSALGLQSKALLCRLLLARIDLSLGDAAAAKRQCESVLRVLADVERPVLAYHANFLLGQALAAMGERSGARQAFEVARTALESLRSRLRGEELKVAFVKNKVDVYEHLVALLMDEEGTAEAVFGCIEQAKSRTLLDLIFQPVHGFARRDAGESELARSIREIREELNWFYHLVEQEQLRPGDQSERRLETFQREIGAREREFSRVLRELEESDPRGSELHSPAVFSAEQVRAALPGDSVLVEFFQTGDRVVVCALDGHHLRVTPVTLMSCVAGHVRMLQFQLSKFRLGDRYLETFGDSLLRATQAHLHELFTELLAPLWPELRGRHLVIVPHGILHYVPFHALFDGVDYVIDSCSVSYAPSASIYTLCHQQSPVTTTGALVLGVSDERAPHIEAEAREVAGVLPGAQLFLGPNATEDTLRLHGAHSRIVHIASHGYFRSETPMFSAIRLGDGYLNVYDLYHLRMPAELVTLSGCATGAASAAAGDELLGLTRGLFLAGARALVLSLWEVHDETASAFMKRFYGAFVAGASPVSALRNTMREIRDQRPHPYYWAPFVLTGKFAANQP